jgi:hypothetical protein
MIEGLTSLAVENIMIVLKRLDFLTSQYFSRAAPSICVVGDDIGEHRRANKHCLR